jgi:hypothetical protein
MFIPRLFLAHYSGLHCGTFNVYWPMRAVITSLPDNKAALYRSLLRHLWRLCRARSFCRKLGPMLLRSPLTLWLLKIGSHSQRCFVLLSLIISYLPVLFTVYSWKKLGRYETFLALFPPYVFVNTSVSAMAYNRETRFSPLPMLSLSRRPMIASSNIARCQDK